jgi:hypothetical protein
MRLELVSILWRSGSWWFGEDGGRQAAAAIFHLCRPPYTAKDPTCDPAVVQISVALRLTSATGSAASVD